MQFVNLQRGARSLSVQEVKPFLDLGKVRKIMPGLKGSDSFQRESNAGLLVDPRPLQLNRSKARPALYVDGSEAAKGTQALDRSALSGGQVSGPRSLINRGQDGFVIPQNGSYSEPEYPFHVGQVKDDLLNRPLVWDEDAPELRFRKACNEVPQNGGGRFQDLQRIPAFQYSALFIPERESLLRGLTQGMIFLGHRDSVTPPARAGSFKKRNLEIQKCQARCSAYKGDLPKPAGRFGRSLVE